MGDPRNILAKQSTEQQPASKRTKTDKGVAAAAAHDEGQADMKTSARVRNQQRRLSRSAAIDLSAANLTADESAPVTDWTMQAFVAMLLRACLAPSWQGQKPVYVCALVCFFFSLQNVCFCVFTICVFCCVSAPRCIACVALLHGASVTR